MSRRARLPYAFLIKSSKNIFSGSGSSSLKAKLEDSSKLERILAYPFNQCLLELARGQAKPSNYIWISGKGWKADVLTGVPVYNNSCQHTPVFLRRRKIFGCSTSVLLTEKTVEVYQEQIHLTLIILHQSTTICQLMLEKKGSFPER